MSHAWARTIDGVQGGTWDQVHLLATPALDRYRGYVGQSRSIAPTHTWNTSRQSLDDGDHGGRLVNEPQGTPAEQIAAALARAQPKTFAAGDDPYRIEADLRAEQDLHRAHLRGRPPDVSDQIANADATVWAGKRDLADWEQRLGHWQSQQAATAGLRGLTRSRRHQHHQAGQHIDAMTPNLERARHGLDQAILQRDQLTAEQSRREEFDLTNQWRVERIAQLDQQRRSTLDRRGHRRRPRRPPRRLRHPAPAGCPRPPGRTSTLRTRHSATRGYPRSPAARSRHPRPRPTASPASRQSAPATARAQRPPARTRHPTGLHATHPFRTEAQYLSPATHLKTFVG